jgi:hypothetical protein
VIILTTFKLHTIYYYYTSLSDKYCKQEMCNYSFIHFVVCLMTGPQPLPNRALHIVWSRASSFKCEYPLLSLRSSSSFVHFLPRLPVTSIPPFIFPSITHCRRQFLCKMWPIQLAFHFLISCRIFLCSLSVIINAENFKLDIVLQGSVFPFGHWGNLIPRTVFSCSEVKG